jgi:tight adherence protein B
LAVIELCDGLAAELHAGLAVLSALERASTGSPEWKRLAAAARLGGDLPSCLRAASREPGCSALRAVAAACDVAGHSGAGLAVVLDSIAGSLRSDEDLRAEVTAALGPARSTARLLAVLPVFGLVLGTSMGAHPLGFLLQTAAGWFCLVGGALLAVAGMWWVERLVRAVEESA